MVVMMVAMMSFGGMHMMGAPSPKEITNRRSRCIIMMRTERNTYLTMLEGKIPSPVRLKPSEKNTWGGCFCTGAICEIHFSHS